MAPRMAPQKAGPISSHSVAASTLSAIPHAYLHQLRDWRDLAEVWQIQLRGGLFCLSERDRQNRLARLVHDLDDEGIPLLKG